MKGESQPRVQWQSVRWPDNSTYEGLVQGDRCHVRGVFKYSNGDRYEGEFEDNNMSGYGVYVWGQEGSVYRGQWTGSMMNGCGVKITKQPAGGYLAEEGRFVNDEWVGDVMGCSIEQARAAAAEADTAAQMARVFEQLGNGGTITEAAARAQEAAATAAAAAQQAKSRRLQRQQRQRQPTAEAPAAAPPAPETAAAFGGAAAVEVAAPSASVQTVLQNSALAVVRQAQQGSQSAGQVVQWAAQQATQGTQQAVHGAQQALQQLMKAGQQKLQKLRHRTAGTSSRPDA